MPHTHARRRAVHRTSATAAAIAMTATALVVPSANALLSDNIHNTAGGGVNIHAENTCVAKIGDTAHVKFMVQHQPLVRSSDHGQAAAHGTLALPSAMKNVSIKLKAVGGAVDSRDKETGYFGDQYRRATVFDTPLDIPILENTAEYAEKFPYGPPVLGGMQQKKRDDNKWEYDPESLPSNKEYTDPDNPDLVYDSTLWAEQEVRDFVEKYNVHMKKTPHGLWSTDYQGDTVPFMHTGSGDVAWYGTEYSKEYDVYEFGNVMMPVTFEVEGDVPVEQKDTFVTAAVSNLGWKSSSESYAGSYAMGSQSLQEYQWARPNQLPPAIPKTEDMIQLYKERLSDAGLDISPTIAPTREMPGDSKYAYIGSDTRPSSRGDAGNNYARTFTLHANHAVTYIGQVDTSAEDGADITAAHVELCEAPPTTTIPMLPPTSEKPTTEKPTTSKPTTSKPTTSKPSTSKPTTSKPSSDKPTTSKPTTSKPTTSEPTPEPNGSSVDGDTVKKVVTGLGIGLGGAALIGKAMEHRGGSSHNESHTTQPAPAPTTTPPAPSTTAQPAPATTTQAAPAPSTSPAPTNNSKTGTLAQTGANVTALAVAGSLIILAGAAFLLAGRRKDSEN